MGKVFLLALVAALAVIFFVPIAGRTPWQVAQKRGLPQAAAKSCAHGLHEAWAFATHAFDAKSPAPAAGPGKRTHRPPARAEARASRSGAGARAGSDHVVPAPPAETLSGDERAALDHLLASPTASR